MEIQSIFKSRKFWLMLVDVIVSLITYFITKYAAPEMTKDVLMVIGLLQPVIIFVITSITVQNVAAMKYLSKQNAVTIVNNNPYTTPYTPYISGSGTVTTESKSSDIGLKE